MTSKKTISSSLICLVLGLFFAWQAASCTGQANGEKFHVDLPEDKHQPDRPEAARPIRLPAVAPTPKNFPNQSAKDIDEMMARAAEISQAVVLIYQWGDPNLDSVSASMFERAKKAGLTPILALSPTTLDRGRKELDLPKDIASHTTFSNTRVRQHFVKQAEKLAALNPPYLCLATEINFLALQRMDEYVRFVALYKEAYKAVKKISPKTQVFVSFQYEFIRILDNKEPGKIADHAKLIDIFRPELDLVAITSYPAPYYSRPADMPSDYYTYLKKYLKPADKVMIMEIGWPSAGLGSPKEQANFIDRLPSLLADISPVATAWALLHDVKLKAFDENLASTGLLTNDGKDKASLKSWREIAEKDKAAK